MDEVEKQSKAMQVEISDRIRRIRDERGWSLEKLSETCGLSKGYLSQIENCERQPTIGALTKIALGLRVEVRTLISGETNKANPTRFTIVRGDERHLETDPTFLSEHIYESITYKKRDRLVDAYVVTLGPNVPKDPVLHEGEELVFVLEGRVEFMYDMRSTILESGDCLYFEADRRHSARSLDYRPAKVLVVFPRR
jgi:transcriptional regulator with XRE-family HTH domain